MTFTVYTSRGPFSDRLVLEFNKIAKAALAETKEELFAQNAANIILVSPFHTLDMPHFGKNILRVEVFDKSIEEVPSGTYYVHENADRGEASKIIVKRFLGFESRKSCVIIPRDITLQTKLEVFAVDRFTPPAPFPAPTKDPALVSPVLHEAPKVHQKKKRTIPRCTIRRTATIALFAIVWLLFLPFVFLLISGGCAWGAMKTFPSRQSVLTAPLLSCSSKSSQLATALSIVSPIKSSLPLSLFINDATRVALDANTLYRALPTFNIESLKEVSPQLFKISREVAVLSSRINEISQLSQFSKHLPTIFKHADLFHVLATGASHADDLLGKSSPKTYLVLLQNNMELRPTGGFIGSFILLHVDNGEVATHKIYDVYDADGQLTGFVKPPYAIEKYLGEASWHLRDSNWDPDFAISAKRATWFLDKSVNEQIDGVIGVDLEVLRTIIRSLGELEVPDYGGRLTAENFYQTIQTEVHKEFFPGSRKKSNYLTAVFNAVLEKLSTEGSSRTLSLLSGLLENLDARDIQLYSTNDSLQNEFIKAGIAGDVSINSLGFVEANVGVNKANQYIERLGSWKFEKGESETKILGKLQIVNSAAERSDETRYRVYLRTFAPKGSDLTELKVSVDGVNQITVPETEHLENREQAGAFIEIKAGEKALVSVSWTSPTSQDISLWKQGGVPAYPISVSVLTGGAQRQYNTTFGEDQHIQL